VWLEHFSVWLEHFSVWLKHFSVWLEHFSVWLEHFSVWLEYLSVWLEHFSVLDISKYLSIIELRTTLSCISLNKLIVVESTIFRCFRITFNNIYQNKKIN
ncbi:MAG: hypothetical protein RO257_15150, partial [Candidatus Kapabacteria bacterium]|nr:hypothetical protein [Candidatus Kapabacteria bacterium]